MVCNTGGLIPDRRKKGKFDYSERDNYQSISLSSCRFKLLWARDSHGKSMSRGKFSIIQKSQETCLYQP